MKDMRSCPVELESAKIAFLEEMASTYGLPDISKVVRCLVNYVRENPDKRDDVFREVRCLDC